MKRRRSRTRLVLAAACVAAACFGGAAGALAEARNPDGIAVIIGNGDYGHRDIPEVRFAHRDAEAFRRYVVDVLGFDPKNVIALRDAKRARLLKLFGRKGDRRSDLWAKLVPDREWDVVVYYSGHGVPGREDGKGYLLPVDVLPHSAQDEGYGIDLLYAKLGQLENARTVQVYLDACFSGNSDGGPLVRNASPVSVRAALPEGLSGRLTSLSASGPDQVASWDTRAGHGLFTHHLLDALHGRGDRNRDGRVTAGEAKAYLDAYMARAAWERYERSQDASLLGTPAALLVSAPANGFPKRRRLGPVSGGAPDPDGGAAGGGGVAEGPAPGGGDPRPGVSPIGGKALLYVDTEPAEAEVRVGGRTIGKTPLKRRDLRAGSWTVVIDHPRYETVELREVKLGDHRVVRLEPRLKRATGSVTVDVTEPDEGAWVEHGGKRRPAPVTLDGVPAGLAKLVLGAPEHREVRVEVEVPKGGVVMVSEGLEPIPYGTLTVTAAPSGASVELPGGEGPYRAGMRLAEGRYRVRVTHPGYRASEADVEVSGATRVRVALERVPPPSVESALGLSRDDRVLVQRGLSAQGFDAGKADGAFGGRTRDALRSWQSGNGFAASGYLTRDQADRLIAAGRKVFPPGKVFRDCPECPEMAVVPAGSFRMGSPGDEEGRYDDEGPVHGVTIPAPFAVGRYEVTFAEWDACVAAGGCGRYRPGDRGWGRGSRPVINVNWNDAKAYVKWLSAKTGKEYRLLSESEWEYAARAGSSTRYSWGDDVGSNRANCANCGDSYERTAPVGSFAANGFGLHDMHGNVWEWVEDCWNGSYRGAPKGGSAWLSGDCSGRVLRGGSWSNKPRYLRAADRLRNGTGYRNAYSGVPDCPDAYAVNPYLLTSGDPGGGAPWSIFAGRGDGRNPHVRCGRAIFQPADREPRAVSAPDASIPVEGRGGPP